MPQGIRLDDLDPEVLAIILEYVDDTSPRTTLSVSLTCKYLASVVKLITHRHKTLRIRGENIHTFHKLPEIVEKWSKDDAFLAHVRSLTVEGLLPGLPVLDKVLENDQLWQPLVDLISKISNLRTLTWNLYGIPIPVLDALHAHHRSAKLKMFKYQPSIDAEPSKRDRALAKSPALTHLRSTLRPIMKTTPHPHMQETAFRRIVKLAPLEYAGVVNYVGDTVAGEPHWKLPFLSRKKPNSSIRVLTLDGYNISKQTLEDWSSIVDLAGLETVKCSRGLPELSYFEHAPVMLPNLKHVSLNFRQVVERMIVDTVLVDAIKNYLATCPPLESLSLWSWFKVVDLEEILQRHGPTLKSLQLHERETNSYEIPRKVLTVTQLKTILMSCPNLKDLTFDLNRQAAVLDLHSEDDNLEYFEILKGSKLDRLQIYFDIGIAYINYQGHNESYDSQDDRHDTDNDSTEQEEGEDGIELGDDEPIAARPGAESDRNDDSGENGLSHTVKRPADNANAEPSVKRQKKLNVMIKPSSEKHMHSYVQDIWTKVFSTSFSARKLDVKFGEWESISGRRGVNLTWMADDEYVTTRFFMARPSERDDQPGLCVVTTKKMHSN